jgi:hypothetical protein
MRMTIQREPISRAFESMQSKAEREGAENDTHNESSGSGYEIRRSLEDLQTERLVAIVIDKNVKSLLTLPDRLVIENGRVVWQGKLDRTARATSNGSSIPGRLRPNARR